MVSSFQIRLLFAAFAAGLILFGSLVVRARISWRAWEGAQTALEESARQHNALAAQIHAAVDQTRSTQSEIDFLHSLINVLPQERGFIRTHRAMTREVEGLRAKVGRRLRQDLHVLVDTQANKLYVKQGLTLLWQADCSAGKGGMLVDAMTGRRWEFVTPRGVFDVLGKIENPVWTKPDWAFVENREPVPPPQDPKRRQAGELGAYVLNLGDGYLIHGTRNEALLGRPASHGCVRLGTADLERLYHEIPRGTRVYIY